MESLEMKETEKDRVQGGRKIETSFAPEELRYYRGTVQTQAQALDVELRLLNVKKPYGDPRAAELVTFLEEMKTQCSQLAHNWGCLIALVEGAD